MGAEQGHNFISPIIRAVGYGVDGSWHNIQAAQTKYAPEYLRVFPHCKYLDVWRSCWITTPPFNSLYPAEGESSMLRCWVGTSSSSTLFSPVWLLMHNELEGIHCKSLSIGHHWLQCADFRPSARLLRCRAATDLLNSTGQTPSQPQSPNSSTSILVYQATLLLSHKNWDVSSQ